MPIWALFFPSDIIRQRLFEPPIFLVVTLHSMQVFFCTSSISSASNADMGVVLSVGYYPTAALKPHFPPFPLNLSFFLPADAKIFTEYLHLSKIFRIFAQSNMNVMLQTDVLHRITQLGKEVLPPGGHLWLYGSRARGDAHPSSDWDLLVLLDKPKREFSDFDKYSYPFIEYGASLGEPISAHIYTKAEWEAMSFTPFYHNVQQDRQVLI